MGLGKLSRSCAGLATCILMLATRSGLAADSTSDSTDAIRAAWKTWRIAAEGSDAGSAALALEKLRALKEDLAIQDLDAFGAAVMRTADARLKRNDPLGALALANAAEQLDPDSLAIHWATAKIHFLTRPLAVSDWAQQLVEGLKAGWRDPLYRRAGFADLGSGALVALFSTAVAVLATLCLRRWRYFIHDFHHLFPRGLARWQTAVLGAILVTLPIALRLGWVPFFITLFAATAMYLPTSERVVAGILVASLGGVPILAAVLVRLTAFAGTPAEDVYRLERGGPESAAAESRIRRKAEDGGAEFAELFALGRLELRRGRLDDAIQHLQKALLSRDNDARALTTLGNAMFAKGDYAGAADSFRRATRSDSSLLAAASNLSKLYSWQARAAGAETVEKQKPPGSVYVNRELIPVPLAVEDLARSIHSDQQEVQVTNELRLRLLGDVPPPLAWLYPAALAALIAALGLAHQAIEACSGCDKCGRPICRKCDPELGMGSLFCNQCVNVFARQGAVAPADKVRKQIEVARYQLRLERTSYALSVLCSGAGHLYLGMPIAGASYAFLFLFAFFGVLFHQGVVRAPYIAERSWIGLAPMLVMLILVHLWSLRDFYRRRLG